jgi:hypothetical protein
MKAANKPMKLTAAFGVRSLPAKRSMALLGSKGPSIE